jgi:hypothetical protein
MEDVRDFLVLHYHFTQGRTEPLWQARQAAPLPDSLAYKVEQFRASGRLMLQGEDLFRDASWFAVMTGQGLRAADHNPMLDSMSEADNLRHLDAVQAAIAKSMAQLQAGGHEPAHAVARGRPRPGGAGHDGAIAAPPPQVLFGPLFEAVQAARIYPDSKTFADATPREAPDAVMAAWRAERPQGADALRAFVERHFVVPAQPGAKPSLREHIAALWPQLTRPAFTRRPVPPRLPCPNPMSCRAGAFAKSITGTAISPCSASRPMGRTG